MAMRAARGISVVCSVMMCAFSVAVFPHAVIAQPAEPELSPPAKINVELRVVAVPDPLESTATLYQARVSGDIPKVPEGTISVYQDGVLVPECTNMPVAYILAYYQVSCKLNTSEKNISATYSGTETIKPVNSLK